MVLLRTISPKTVISSCRNFIFGISTIQELIEIILYDFHLIASKIFIFKNILFVLRIVSQI